MTADPKPVDHIISRVFHFSIVMPFIRLDERLAEPIAIDGQNNDVCLMAADICVSCYHIIEQIKESDPDLATRLVAFEGWHLIGDIANTRKHYIRQNAARQITMSARLLYEYRDGMFGFLETEPLATTAAGMPHHVGDLIVGFIDRYIRASGSNGGSGVSPFDRQPRKFEDRIVVRVTPETSTASQTVFRVIQRNGDGGFEPADVLKMPHPKMILDVPEKITTGRYQLRFDTGLLAEIVAANNAAVEEEIGMTDG